MPNNTGNNNHVLDAYGKRTGTYILRGGKLIKISPHPRIAPPVDVYVPHDGYWDEHLGHWDEKTQSWRPAFIHSREQKRALMRERTLVVHAGRSFVRPVRRKYFT